MITYSIHERIVTTEDEKDKAYTTISEQTLVTKLFGITLHKKILDSIIKSVEDNTTSIGFKK